MPLSEYHTSDLINPCRRAVQLRHEGKIIGQTTTALYLGLVFHEAATMVHTMNLWDRDSIRSIATKAGKIVSARVLDEGRPKSHAVIEAEPELLAEVCEWIEAYQVRFADYFASARLIGCELPVRLTLDVDGVPAEFASHIDLAFYVGDFVYVWDWKTVEDSPTRDYLRRNKQLGLYHLCFERGRVEVPTFDDLGALVSKEWVEFGDAPIVEWVQVRNLMPFKKAQSVKDETGKVVQYKKGDTRPHNAVVRDVLINNTDAVIEDLREMVRMDRAGLHPTNPNTTGCHLCDSRTFCKHYETESTNAQ